MLKLQAGEGGNEAVAAFHNIEEAWQQEGRRIGEVLCAHLIQWDGGGSRGFAVNVATSQADRARSLLARIIIDEHLRISLTKTNKDGKGWSKGGNLRKH